MGGLALVRHTESGMKWPDLRIPTGTEKPSWPGLFGTAALVYLFIDPYRAGASWDEWLWTGLAFVVFVGLSIVGLIYWSRPRVIQCVCVAMVVVAVAFTAYRPAGVVFFIFVAGFGPLAVAGNLVWAAAIVGSVSLLALVEWWLFWPSAMTPYVIAIESILIGGAIAFLVRQQVAVREAVTSAERERIARDLHDVLGHTLSVIILKSELAGRLIEGDPRRARLEVADVERIARHALTEVRHTIVGYQMNDLQTEFDRAKATLETAGIAAECRFAPVGLPATHDRVLALALREAVTNVVRHAQARTCRVTLQVSGGLCTVQVTDDGRGGALAEGVGMRGIRERAAAIGGEAVWRSRTSGTELSVTVPIVADPRRVPA